LRGPGFKPRRKSFRNEYRFSRCRAPWAQERIFRDTL
jgi:hypothetical protein